MSARWLGATAFLLVAMLAIRGTCPTVYLDDSPETVTAAMTLGIAHPPGDAPLMLLGRLACAVPLGSPALRMNLLSGLLVALVAGWMAAVTGSIAASLSGRAIATAAAVLVVMHQPALVHLGGVAKGATYGLNLLFLLWCGFMLVRGRWVAAALPAGLLAAHHWMTAGLYLPVWIVAAALLRAGWPRSRRTIALALVVFTVGASFILALPIRSAARPPLDWGATRTTAGMARHLLRTEVIPTEMAPTRATVAGQAGAILIALVRSVGWIGLLLALVGGAGLVRQGHRWAGAGITVAILLPPAVMVAYFQIPTDRAYLYDAFLLPTWLMLAAALIRGAVGLSGRPGGMIAALVWLLLFPLPQLGAVRLGSVRHATWSFDLARALLASAPRGSGLALASDLDTFPIWHAQMVLDEHPEVPVINHNLLRHGWYRRATAGLARVPAWHGPSAGGLPAGFLRAFTWRGYYDAASRLPAPHAELAVGYTGEAVRSVRSPVHRIRGKPL